MVDQVSSLGEPLGHTVGMASDELEISDLTFGSLNIFCSQEPCICRCYITAFCIWFGSRGASETMSSFQDVGLPLLTVVVLSPVAILSFRYGVPIELIVFGLLFAGYKAPKWCRAGTAKKSDDSPVAVVEPSKEGPPERAFWRPWKARNREKSGKQNSEAKAAKPKSGAALLKKNASQTQWRSIINKFTPEKFEKLCEQLLGTLPKQGPNTAEKTTCCDSEFSKILEELLSMIFDACSRQHQYTEMYADLCQKLLDHVAMQRPNLDGRACVWGRCQHIFHTSVLKPPEISTDLPEDEYMDRKAKVKEKMVAWLVFLYI